MNVVELIKKKRDGKILLEREISYLVQNYSKGRIPDYQFSAFLMAGFLKGMTEEETSFLTGSMLESGKTIDLSSLKGPKIDKHSTGGVGDKTSLIIAPVVAAAGINVPMISGRGLGHTGGTLDKLESIPGFKIDLTISQFKKALQNYGTAMIGQTSAIAPADKLIYALRDVTATVESNSLITASIMSKKLAEGIDGLVLDVKTGSGAFMKKLTEARALARSIIETAKLFDKKIIVMITDMNQPLGNSIGNWLEVTECIKVLQGDKIKDLLKLSLYLSGAMIYLGGKAESIEKGREVAAKMIETGKAFDKFRQIVKSQKGNLTYIDNPAKYPKSKYSEKIYSEKSGYIKAINTYEIGMAALDLGAGRLRKEDTIDPKAGIIFYPKISGKILKDSLVAEIYTDNRKSLGNAKDRIKGAIEISSKKGAVPKLIKEIIY